MRGRKTRGRRRTERESKVWRYRMRSKKQEAFFSQKSQRQRLDGDLAHQIPRRKISNKLGVRLLAKVRVTY